METLETLAARHEAFRARGLSINMARGKPSPEQLDLMAPLLAWSAETDYIAADGTDCRNYGGDPAGLPELRSIFADILDLPVEQIVAEGNSSLALMSDVLTYLVLHGSPAGGDPWKRHARTVILCPVPGFDRHFRLCQMLGLEMEPVPMTEEGPDIDVVERRVAEDPDIRGLWCMPRFSNPTGDSCSAAVVERLARMPTAAPDFHIFWDDAYAVHGLTDEAEVIPNIVTLASEAGHPARPIVFTTTSKITLATGGCAILAGSPEVVDWWLSFASVRSLGPDKLNQIRHARFLKNAEGVRALMAEHRRLLAPKFETFDRIFSQELSGLNSVHWTRPKGGYFIALTVTPGCARRTIQLSAEAGVHMTAAGAPFLDGHDPDDRLVRIAPTFPGLPDITAAAEGIAISAKLAMAERR